ncbi:hypothetical protein OG302_27130 [Streptomyces sp. NBC_01283]|uniref:hypothetical protein n=1 Tax=Streptomyces sp. NBC_01283 TaxID=2903812 RepID=UPI00352BEC18|nr:hypothetical protein OG302_27130 [Streptomyces sp. NBC_01283]
MAGDEYTYDALMPALTDEPLPETARRDPELLAEHAAAVADVALLREHLGVAGRALAAPAAEPEPEPPPEGAGVRPAGVRRRRLTMALGLAAAAAAVSLVGGVSWLALESGGGISKSSDDSDAAKGAAPGAEDGSGSADQKSGAYVPCARLIVEGTVNRVEPLPGGSQDRIVLDVTRYYKPSKGAKQVTFVMDANVDPRLRPGDRTLIGIPKGQKSPDLWSGNKADIARDRAFIERELREGKGRGMTC